MFEVGQTKLNNDLLTKIIDFNKNGYKKKMNELNSISLQI